MSNNAANFQDRHILKDLAFVVPAATNDIPLGPAFYSSGFSEMVLTAAFTGDVTAKIEHGVLDGAGVFTAITCEDPLLTSFTGGEGRKLHIKTGSEAMRVLIDNAGGAGSAVVFMCLKGDF